MRKNLDEYPDNRWTDREILTWSLKNEVIDEARRICPTDKQVQKSHVPIKEGH